MEIGVDQFRPGTGGSESQQHGSIPSSRGDLRVSNFAGTSDALSIQAMNALGRQQEAEQHSGSKYPNVRVAQGRPGGSRLSSAKVYDKHGNMALAEYDVAAAVPSSRIAASNGVERSDGSRPSSATDSRSVASGTTSQSAMMKYQLKREQARADRYDNFDPSELQAGGTLDVPLVIAASTSSQQPAGERLTGAASNQAGVDLPPGAVALASAQGGVSAWASAYLRSMDPSTTRHFLARDLGALWAGSGVTLMDVRRLLARAVHRGVWDWRSDARIVVDARPADAAHAQDGPAAASGGSGSGWDPTGWPSGKGPAGSLRQQRRRALYRQRAVDLVLLQRYGKEQFRKWRRSIGGAGGARPHPLRPPPAAFGPSAVASRGPAAVARSGTKRGQMRGINQLSASVGPTSPGHDDGEEEGDQAESVRSMWAEFREGDGMSMTPAERAKVYYAEAAAFRSRRERLARKEPRAGGAEGQQSSAADSDGSEAPAPSLPSGHRTRSKSVHLAQKQEQKQQSRQFREAIRLGLKLGVDRLLAEDEMGTIREAAVRSLPASLLQVLDPESNSSSKDRMAHRVHTSGSPQGKAAIAAQAEREQAEHELEATIKHLLHQAVGRAVMRVSGLIQAEDERRTIAGELPVEATIVVRSDGSMDMADLSTGGAGGGDVARQLPGDASRASAIVRAMKQQRYQYGTSMARLYRRWVYQPGSVRVLGQKAATRIQAVWRGWRDRLRVSYLHTFAFGRLRSLAASTIQAWYRSFQAVRKAHYEAHSRRQAAATINRLMGTLKTRLHALRKRANQVLTRAMRRWKTRRSFEQVIMLHRSKGSHTIRRKKAVQSIDTEGRSYAAARIQGLFRGAKIRAMVRPVMRARDWARGRIGRWLSLLLEKRSRFESQRQLAMQWFRKCRRTIIQFQALWRGHCGRKLAAKLATLEQDSAIDIQRIARGFLARRLAVAAKHRSESAWRLVLGRHAGDKRPAVPIKESMRRADAGKLRRNSKRSRRRKSVSSYSQASAQSDAGQDQDAAKAQEARARRAEFDVVRPVNRIRWLAEVGRMVVDGNSGSVRSGWVYVNAGNSINAYDAAIMEGTWRMAKGGAESTTIDPTVQVLVDKLRAAKRAVQQEKRDRRKQAARRAERTSGVSPTSSATSSAQGTQLPFHAADTGLSGLFDEGGEMEELRQKLPFLPAALHVEVGRLVQELNDAIIESASGSEQISKSDAARIPKVAKGHSVAGLRASAASSHGSKRPSKYYSLTRQTMGSPDWIKQLHRARREGKRQLAEMNSPERVKERTEEAFRKSRRMTPSMRMQRKRTPARLRAGGLPVSKLAADDPAVDATSSMFERMFVSRRPLDTNPLQPVLPGAGDRSSASRTGTKGRRSSVASMTSMASAPKPLPQARIGRSESRGHSSSQRGAASVPVPRNYAPSTTNRDRTSAATAPAQAARPTAKRALMHSSSALRSSASTRPPSLDVSILDGLGLDSQQTDFARSALLSRTNPSSPLSPLKPLNTLPSASSTATAPEARAVIRAQRRKLEPLHDRLGKTSEFLETRDERYMRMEEQRQAAVRAIAQYEAWLEDVGDQLPGKVRSERLRIRKRAAALVRERILKDDGSGVLFPEISKERRQRLADELSQAVRYGRPFNLDPMAPVRELQRKRGDNKGMSMAKRIAKRREEAQARSIERHSMELSREERMARARERKRAAVQDATAQLGGDVERSLGALAGMVAGMAPKGAAAATDGPILLDPEALSRQTPTSGTAGSHGSSTAALPRDSTAKSQGTSSNWLYQRQLRDPMHGTQDEEEEDWDALSDDGDGHGGRIRLTSLATDASGSALDASVLPKELPRYHGGSGAAREGVVATPRLRDAVTRHAGADPNPIANIVAQVRYPVPGSASMPLGGQSSPGQESMGSRGISSDIRRSGRKYRALQQEPFDAAGWVAGVQKQSAKEVGRPSSRFVAPIDRASKVLAEAHGRKKAAKMANHRSKHRRASQGSALAIGSTDDLAETRNASKLAPLEADAIGGPGLRSVGVQYSFASLPSSVSSGSILVDLYGPREDRQVRRLMQERGDASTESSIEHKASAANGRGKKHKSDAHASPGTGLNRAGRFPVATNVLQAATRAKPYGSSTLETGFGAHAAYSTISVIEADGDDKAIPLPGFDKPGGVLGYDIGKTYKAARPPARAVPRRTAKRAHKTAQRSHASSPTGPAASKAAGKTGSQPSPAETDPKRTYAQQFETPSYGRAMGLLAKAVGHVPESPEVMERRIAKQIPLSMRHDAGARQANAMLRDRARSRARRNSTQGVMAMLLETQQRAAADASKGIGSAAGALAAAQAEVARNGPGDSSRVPQEVQNPHGRPQSRPWDDAAGLGFKDLARLADGTGRRAGISRRG